jgi:hypothetical protein
MWCRSRQIPALALLVILPFLAAVPASGTGILVPAYFYPSWWDAEANQWDELIAAASQVSLVAIMNPNSGPGSAPNSDYTHEVDPLRAAGGRVIGYVPTTYGNRPLTDVLTDVDAYYAWYDIDGIYFDEATNDDDPTLVAYYQSCHDYVRSLDAAAMVVLGQGASGPEQYAAAATQLSVREGDDQLNPFLDWQPRDWTSWYSDDRFVAFIHNVVDADAMRTAVDHAVANGVAWIYFTDDALPNPWDSLPSYWQEEIDHIAAASPRPGILVPAYFYPSWWDAEANQWDELIAAASQVPLVAIMNPNSGPGSAPNSDYTHEVDPLRAAGGRVIGYVPTTYGTRPLADVLAEVDAYYAWYDIDGIYFDETTNDDDPTLVAYYQSCHDYVRSLDAAAMVVLGQGTSAPEPYAAAATQLSVREGDDQLNPFLDWQPRDWTSWYSADRFVAFIHNVVDADAMRAAVDHAVANGVAWMYFTDDTLLNPWDSLPSYWQEEIDHIAGTTNTMVSVDHLTSTRLTARSSYGKRKMRIAATVTNTSATALATPLLLVVESISLSSVTVADADGFTAAGQPYFDLSSRIDADALDPGARTQRLTMSFQNPERRFFTVQTHIYQQIQIPAAKPSATALEQSLPAEQNLAPNYPNPFNASTHIAYRLPQAADVRLTVFDALGRKVRLLVHQAQQAGEYQVVWNGRDDAGRAVASGSYFYRLQTAPFAQTRQMLLLK